ncbi:MAG: trypsin-like peptidase domain-containing protein [bacterium]|nr:trypsin-like peptidase domain-containing protein [bacterium]
MRLKTLLPWILLAAVLAYVYTQQHGWPDMATRSSPTFAHERPLITTPAPAVVAGNAAVSYAGAVKAAAPAVVNIYTTQKVREHNPFMNDPFFRHFFGEGQPQERLQTSLGSGVIASPEGYVLTNNHVVEQADEIIVALQDGREIKARVIGTDPGTDLAVLKIDLDHLPVLPFRESPVQVGDVVLAIGNPFGVGQTVTQGIISAIGRHGMGINTFEDFIQTDAAINPGNSGGALIDVSGNMVGINSAIFSQSGGSLGIGFAIPGALVKTVMQAIIRDGKVVRGWLGIEVQTLDPQLAAHIGSTTTKGAAIAGIVRGGPAHAAGMKAGDILLRLNDTEVSNASQAINLIAGFKPGSTQQALLLRDKSRITVKVKVGERPAQIRDRRIDEGAE